MAGNHHYPLRKPLDHRRRHHRFPDLVRQTERRSNLAMLIAMSMAGVLLVVLCMVMLEERVRRQDISNQEQLVWRCNGNGGADHFCLPIART